MGSVGPQTMDMFSANANGLDSRPEGRALKTVQLATVGCWQHARKGSMMVSKVCAPTANWTSNCASNNLC